MTLRKLAVLVGSAFLGLACRASDSVDPPLLGPQIEVRYIGTLTAQQQSAVVASIDKWTRAVSKERGAFRLYYPANDCFPGAPGLDETHINLLVFVSVAEIDGPSGLLASSQICAISSRDKLPILSHLRLDQADVDSMEARGLLGNVILHEFGHALGFNPATYVPKGLVGGGSNDPYFNGSIAQGEFRKHGAWYSGAIVPLEDASGDGPNNPHWRFSVFGDELMVGSISRGFKAPLSVITLGLFADLGYDVDFSMADPYEVAPLFGANRLVPESSLANDIKVVAPPTVVAPVISR